MASNSYLFLWVLRSGDPCKEHDARQNKKTNSREQQLGRSLFSRDPTSFFSFVFGLEL